MDKVRFMACPVCGGELEEVSGGRFRCEYCDGVFTKENLDRERDVMHNIHTENGVKNVRAAMKNLYDALHEEYMTRDRCLSYAYMLKVLVPSDYYASFAVIANSKGDAETCDFLNGSSKEDMEIYAPAVLDFMLMSLSHRTCATVSAYIERAFSPTSDEYRKYMGLYDDIAAKVNLGVFNYGCLKDAFIAYSSKDIVKAAELCDYLGSLGVTCIFPSRNLRHVALSAEDYQKDIKTAMDCCRTFVFVSSRNSRSGEGDAFSKELVYIRDMENALREMNITSPPPRFKRRVEYLIEDYAVDSLYDNEVMDFFQGTESAMTMEDVGKRILDCSSLEGMDTINYDDYPEYFWGELERALLRDDAEAQYDIGNTYYIGFYYTRDGTDEVNFPEAVKWYRKSAEQGHDGAQYQLGVCYYYGLGVERDRSEAVKWYRKSAEQGDMYAQHHLGRCYYYGTGVEQDYVEAVKWLRMSSEQHIDEARELLREMGMHENRPGIDDKPLEHRHIHDETDGMPATLRRGDAYFTDTRDLYLAGCRAYGWDERKKNGFGKHSPMYAGDATREHYAVWCPCNSDLTMNEEALRNSGIQNYVRNGVIEERVRNPRSHSLGQDNPDEIRVTFVRIKNPGKPGFIYMFYGIIKCESIRYEDDGNLMIRTFRLISETHVNSGLDPKD